GSGRSRREGRRRENAHSAFSRSRARPSIGLYPIKPALETWAGEHARKDRKLAHAIERAEQRDVGDRELLAANERLFAEPGFDLIEVLTDPRVAVAATTLLQDALR